MMAVFAIRFEKDSDILFYITKFKNNIDSNVFFDGKLVIEDNMAFFYIRPLIFPIYLIAPLIWVFGSIFAGGINWGVFGIGMIPGITYLLYTKYWYILMLYIGKWKGKYKGKIKLV